MKKLLSIFLILSLLLSFSACGDHGDDGENTNNDTEPGTEDTADLGNIIYADTEEILALAKSVPMYAGIDCVTQTQIHSVYTQNILLTEFGSYTRDTAGNILTQVYDEAGTPVSAEYLIGNEYYSGAQTDGDGVKITLSDDEKSSVSASMQASGTDGLIYSLDDFSDIEAVDNEDGSYTLLCSSSDEAVTGKLVSEIKDEIDAAYDGYESYTVSSVDYQYTLGSDGKLLGFVIMATIEVEMSNGASGEEETTNFFSFGNFVSYVYAAAVNDYTETVSAEKIDLSGVSITESTYSEHFGG